jgi:hypothetical protein
MELLRAVDNQAVSAPANGRRVKKPRVHKHPLLRKDTSVQSQPSQSRLRTAAERMVKVSVSRDLKAAGLPEDLPRKALNPTAGMIPDNISIGLLKAAAGPMEALLGNPLIGMTAGATQCPLNKGLPGTAASRRISPSMQANGLTRLMILVKREIWQQPAACLRDPILPEAKLQ